MPPIDGGPSGGARNACTVSLFSVSRSRMYDNNLALVMSANRRRVNRSFACFGLLTNVVATAGITIDAAVGVGAVVALVLLS